MDQKYLSEIKTREHAATPGPWEQTGAFKHIIAQNNGNDTDLSTIIAEVWKKRSFADLDERGQANMNFIIHARKDIPALIAEVERLMAENEQNAAYAEIYQDICDKYGKNFRALLEKAKELQTERNDLQAQIDMYGGDEGITAAIQERDTLKKALELACEDQVDLCPYGLHGKNRRCSEEHKPVLCKSCAPEYYIHQAEQIVHEKEKKL